MLKKRLGMFIALILMVSMVAGCSQSSKKTDTANTDSKKQIVMKVGHSQNIDTPRHKSYQKFKELVEQKTNNGIKVEIFPSGQIGDESAMMDATKLGTLQGTRGGTFEKVAPELLVYTLPFLFDSLDGIEKVTMGPIGDKIAKAAEKNGLVVLSTGDAGGFRDITNNRRPILSPDDMKGLKIRTPGIESIIKTMEAFGANPVSIPFGDVYMSLKTNVADGQENPPVNIESLKLHEVQKYMTVINYQFHPDPFVVNQKWYNSLSPEYQKILKECATEAMKYNDQLLKEANQKAMDNMKQSMEITVLTPEQRNAFREKAKPVWDYYISKGICSQKDIEEIRNAAK